MISSFSHRFSLIIIVVVIVPLVVGTEDDVRCLKGFKNLVNDPEQNLNSWSFKNTTPGVLCGYDGISCWNNQENRVISLSLSSRSLSGTISDSLQFCPSITSLDLSRNSFSGEIPKGICNWLPFLVTLDLSKNQFSGSIPSDLGKCQYLKKLLLNENNLSGSIPDEFSRLTTFTIANNHLSGGIPISVSKFSSSSFEGNKDLCGKPLTSCNDGSTKKIAIIVAAGVFGAAASVLLGFGIRWLSIRSAAKRWRGIEEDDRWIEKLRSYRSMQISLFEKPLVKLRLNDLIPSFRHENLIQCGKIGTTYRAILRDGSALAVKRLPPCSLPEKQFYTEVNRLGQIRHPNLVPLLGFCVVADERFLIYKHMPCGTLSSLLHNPNPEESRVLDWPTRLKIAIGASRGLVYLHHLCNPSLMHRNISSEAILLDDDYDARITDFGITGLLHPQTSNGGTSFVIGEFGNVGYVAPEYSSTMIVSTKGDIYGFGVVLLELISGEKPLEVSRAHEGFKGNLVSWVDYLSINGDVKDTIDVSLRGNAYEDEIVDFLKVALDCVSSSPNARLTAHHLYDRLRSIGKKHNFSHLFEEIVIGRK